MNIYRFTLEAYKSMKSRYRCPQSECGKGKTFTRYIDNETGEYIADNVGRCSRESNCGYHYTPKQYFRDNGSPFKTTLPKENYIQRALPAKPNTFSFIEVDIFKQSLQNGKGVLQIAETNHFVNILLVCLERK